MISCLLSIKKYFTWFNILQKSYNLLFMSLVVHFQDSLRLEVKTKTHNVLFLWTPPIHYIGHTRDITSIAIKLLCEYIMMEKVPDHRTLVTSPPLFGYLISRFPRSFFLTRMSETIQVENCERKEDWVLFLIYRAFWLYPRLHWDILEYFLQYCHCYPDVNPISSWNHSKTNTDISRCVDPFGEQWIVRGKFHGNFQVQSINFIFNFFVNSS